MLLNQIIEHLIAQSKRYRDIKEFSDKPGIYALFFYGANFPLDGFQPKSNEIIYIGKTESSQQSRDADTHFASGKTGSSTLRRTFGAFLRKQLKLSPIPRGQSDIEKNRTLHYKFDEYSELKLTEWMQQNLGLSFYPYDKTPKEIDYLESQLIHKIIPVLNIDRKNPNNPHKSIISSLRKQTGLIAYNSVLNSTKLKQLITSNKSIDIKPNNYVFGGKIHKYRDIWTQISEKIIFIIKNGESNEISLNANAFKVVGNRKSYNFNLEFNNGKVSNNIGGSAVARDLAEELQSNHSFKKVSVGKHIKLKLDSNFDLYISFK